MKETVPQKPLEPVLHGFLLSDRTSVPTSKNKILNFFGLLSTNKNKPENFPEIQEELTF